MDLKELKKHADALNESGEQELICFFVKSCLFTVRDTNAKLRRTSFSS